jgi:hypothetical protein
VFFSLQFFCYYETQQLILGTGTAIWWVTEPYCKYFSNKGSFRVAKLSELLSAKMPGTLAKAVFNLALWVMW